MKKFDLTNYEKNNVEWHIPGYQFCGPGTKVFTRLQRGDQGINAMDRACRIHDIEYFKYAGDDKGLRRADKRLRSSCKKIGGRIPYLIDKAFFFKNLGETLKFYTPSSFANKLSKGLSIPMQREIGNMLYDKYVDGKQVNINEKFV